MTSTRVPPVISRITALLASRYFFRATVGLLMLQAAWIALSGRYPMAFDENFHLGIIRIYAHHINPFLADQPAGADSFGAVARDPSYLYHYLLSYPYRLINLLTNNQMAQVLCLRAINIALFACSLPLMKRVLLKTGASKPLVHIVLFIYVLLPVVPLLAAQINYDNLLLPVTGLIFLLAINFVEQMRRYTWINSKRLVLILSLCLLASLIKYAFLPIFVAVLLYLGYNARQTYKGSHKFWLSMAFGLTLMTRLQRLLLIILFVFSLGLFTQRYGINIVRYHTPLPDCANVLSAKQCDSYGPWARDHYLETHKSSHQDTSLGLYLSDWFYGMWFRTFFAVDGPATNFQTRPPLTLPGLTGIVVPVLGSAGLLLAVRQLYKLPQARTLAFLALAASVYILVLLADGYQSFTGTGQPVAINGRYLLPVLPIVLLLWGSGMTNLLARRPYTKASLAAIVCIGLLWGGGVATYILRSNDSWYWHNTPASGFNHNFQRTLGPLTPGYGQSDTLFHQP